MIQQAKLFKTQNGIKSIAELSDSDHIDSVFEAIVTEQLTTGTDLISFAKRVGLKPEQLSLNYGNNSHRNDDENSLQLFSFSKIEHNKEMAIC